MAPSLCSGLPKERFQPWNRSDLATRRPPTLPLIAGAASSFLTCHYRSEKSGLRFSMNAEIPSMRDDYG